MRPRRRRPGPLLPVGVEVFRGAAPELRLAQQRLATLQHVLARAPLAGRGDDVIRLEHLGAAAEGGAEVQNVRASGSQLCQRRAVVKIQKQCENITRDCFRILSQST